MSTNGSASRGPLGDHYITEAGHLGIANVSTNGSHSGGHWRDGPGQRARQSEKTELVHVAGEVMQDEKQGINVVSASVWSK